MNKVKSKKKTSPSRERYEGENPTISARIPKKTREALFSSLKNMGISLSDALINLAGELEVKAALIDEARQEGYKEAEDRYMITHPCSVCGEPIPITSPRAKEAASRYMTEHGWAHASCHEKRRES